MKRPDLARRNYRHGLSKSLVYGVWSAMVKRCHNPNDRDFYLYGARGVLVCDRWRHDPAAFVADMGPRPPGASIDRIDSNGNYEPANCRWATPLEQGRNTSRNRKITFRGRTQILEVWAQELGIDAPTIRARLDRLGWSVERALTAPVRTAKVSRVEREERKER